MADKKSVAKAYVQVVPTTQGIKGILSNAFGAEGASAGGIFGGELIGKVKGMIADADIGTELTESIMEGIDLDGSDLEGALGFGDMLKANFASGAILNAIEEIGKALLELGKTAVVAAADVKAENAQFAQTFKGLESTARSALELISEETGIASTRIQGAYTSLYAFTKSVGGDSATALRIAQRAMNAAADSAAYYDRTVEEVTDTLQSFLKGNYENDAALGIAATETTRNAKANELYAKSFKDLTEAQKVDTLLAMVEAGNAASGALGQAAREAGEWTNVTGELAEAWRLLLAQLGGPVLEGLTPLIQSITGALKDMTAQSSVEVLRAGIDSFREGLAAADTQLQDSNASMEATTGLAQQYLDRLRALEAAGLGTAESQREYAQTVELLNTLMPELNLSIDENTGRLEQNSAAIADNIQSLKEQAQQQAKQAYYSKLIAEASAIYEQQYAAKQRLIELQELENQLIEQGADGTIAYDDALYGAASGMYLFCSEISVLDQKLIDNRAEQIALTAELEQLDAAIADHANTLDLAQAGYDGLTAAEQEAADAASAQADVQADLATAYAEATKAARESIDSQIGLFEELADESDWSAARIVENWEKQQKAFANYGDNLQKAVDMGLDEALVQQLSDGSQQSMQILDALVNDTGISIDEINASFRGLNESKDQVSEVMGEIAVITDETMDEMVRLAKEGGYNTAAGAAKGVRDSTSLVESAMQDMAKKAQLAYNRTMEINSPSRVMEESGEWTALGGVKGVKNIIPDMEQVMAELGDRGTAAYNRNRIMEAAVLPPQIAAGSASNTVNHNSTVSYGGISVNIYTQPGQDEHSIADAVLEELTHRMGQEAAAFG